MFTCITIQHYIINLSTVSFAPSKPKVLRNVSVFLLSICN